MKGHAPNNDPTVTAMTMDLLGKVLSRADDPRKLGEYLTEEIRELTGARCVIFTQSLDAHGTKSHRVVAVNPIRRLEWAESDAIYQLYEEIHQLPTSQIWRMPATSQTAKRLQKEGFELSLTVPLMIGENHVGSMLALGLPDAEHLDAVTNLLNTLSTVTALVLRNAFFSENQNQIIETRTSELRLANNALRANDAHIRALLEKSERAQQALLSLLEDQKAVVTALRESEERLRRAVINSPFPVMIHTEDGQVLMISDAWSEISGYTHAEIPTTADWTEKAYGQRKQVVQADIDRLYGLTKREREGEYAIHTKEGILRIWDFMSAPLGKLSDNRRMVISMAMDVTERRAAESEIHRLNAELEQRVVDRTAKLEASNKELEAFSYSISHDLRSPLRAINGFAHILRKDYSAILNDEGQRHLEVICSESKRMGQLVDDLLAFSRMNREPLHTIEINLTALTQSVFNECFSHAPGRQVQLKLLPLPTAHADPPMIRQALVNLIANAIKYTRPKALAEIEVGARQETDEIVFYVKDNGVGFDPKYTDKLFGVFQRLHSENEFEGTGVGLALVQRIIHRHGGRIWAESNVDEGATFYFTIPMKNGE